MFSLLLVQSLVLLTCRSWFGLWPLPCFGEKPAFVILLSWELVWSGLGVIQVSVSVYSGYGGV